MNYWKSWFDIEQLCLGRQVVFYGRSEDWLPKSLRKIVPVVIIDNNEKYHETKYEGIAVHGRHYLYSDAFSERPYVVITAGIFDGIINELLEHGFVAGEDFSCCPEFQDYSALENIKGHKTKILVSCSDYNEPSRARYSRGGGGLYIYDMSCNEVEKVASGSFRQVIKHEDKICAVEYVLGELQLFNSSFQLQRSFKLDAPNYCGLAFINSMNCFATANSSFDCITLICAKSGELVNKIYFSELAAGTVTSEHHLNDLTIIGDEIYVSYFSYSGAWKRGFFDGGVSVMSATDLSKPPKQIITDLWKPHSPEFIDGNFCVLDSMRGDFVQKTHTRLGPFQAFLRGLTFDGKYYYLGASEDMYLSERFGESDNLLLNAGIFRYDPKIRASRFYPLMDNMNVHDLLFID